MVKISEHTIVMKRHPGSSRLTWYVKDGTGKTVGSVTISPHTNRWGSFSCNMSSGVTVTAHGPVFHEVQTRLWNEMEDRLRRGENLTTGTAGQDIYLQASIAAGKADHEKVWSRHAAGPGRTAQRLSEGRDIARTEAWPWLKSILGVSN